MADNKINFIINFNAYKGVAEVGKAMKKLNVTMRQTLTFFDRMNEISFKLNNISQSIKGMSDNKRSAIEPGVKLDASLRDLSAIAGVTGDKLKEIKGYARSAAKTFVSMRFLLRKATNLYCRN